MKQVRGAAPHSHRRRAAVCACLLGLGAAALPPTLPAAAYTQHGHYGFATLTHAEAGAAVTFAAALVPVGATNACVVRGVYSVPTPAGWQVYVGGWPVAAQGACDLVLRACAADGSVRAVTLTGAVTVAAERMDVALLLDDSFSMRRTDPARLRVAAARLFARVAASRGTIRTLTIVAFSRSARLLLPPTDPADHAAVDRALAGVVAEGSTDMDAAFAEAARTFADLPPSRKVAVVLSDGHDQPGAYEDAHLSFAAAHWPVYTVGLSELADANTLRRIAGQTGGEYRFAPDTQQIEAIFQQIVLSLHGAVVIGEWPLDHADVPVPVDDSVRLLTLALDAPADARCRVSGPGSPARELAADAASNAVCEIHAPQRGAWQVSAATGAVLRATAGSDLELVPFPVAEGITDAVPVRVYALLLRGFEPVTGATVRAELSSGGAVALAEGAPGRYAGWLVPAGTGGATCRVTASGQTPAGWPFQRVATQAWQVSPERRDSLWVQPLPAALALYPGSAVTGAVEIAGRGVFAAALQTSGAVRGVSADLLDSAGQLPEGAARALRVAVCAGAEATPGTGTAQVTVIVGTLPPAHVPVVVTVRPPDIATAPTAFDWHRVPPGSIQTGSIAAVLTPGGALRIRASARGGADVSPGDSCVWSPVTSLWQVVVVAPAGTGTQVVNGTVELDWGWGRRAIPWQVSVEPPPVIAAAPTNTPAAAAAPPPVAAAPLPPAPEPVPVIAAEPVVGSRFNWPHLGLIVLLALLLGWLLGRLLRRPHTHRLTQDVILSLLLHVAFLLLALDLLVQARVVQIDQISPALAVQIEVLEQKLGVALMPPVGLIAVADTESAARVARAGAQVVVEEARRGETRLPDTEVAPAQTGLAPPARPTGLAPDAADAVKQRTAMAAVDEVRAVAEKPVARPEPRETLQTVRVDAARPAAGAAGDLPDVRDASVAEVPSVSVARSDASTAPTRAVATPDAGVKQTTAADPDVAPAVVPTPKPTAVSTAVAAAPSDLAVGRVSMDAAARGAASPARAAPAQMSLDQGAADGPSDVVMAAGPMAVGAQRTEVADAGAAAGKRMAVPAETLPLDATGATGGVSVARTGGRAAGAGAADQVTAASVGVARGMRQVTAADARGTGGWAQEASAQTTSDAPGNTTVAAADGVGAASGRSAGGGASVPPGAVSKQGVAAADVPPGPGADEVAVRRGATVARADESGPVRSTVPAAAGRLAAAGDSGGGRGAGAPTADTGLGGPTNSMAAMEWAPDLAQRVAVAGTGVAIEKRRAVPDEGAQPAGGDVAGVGKAGARHAAGGRGVAAADAVAALGVARGQRSGGSAARERGVPVDAMTDVSAAASPVTDAASKIAPPRLAGLPGVRGDAVAGDLSLRLGEGRAGTVNTTLGLARYGGDWDCAKTAMMFLGHQLRERTGMGLMAGDRVVTLDDPALGKLPFVYLTGHHDFRFTDAEIRNLRAYLQGGGHLWADDSTHYRDETFDRAFRRELARLLPGAPLERLGADFDGFRTGYDLSQGYKGYAIPPGDKYRLDYIEGVRLGARVAVIYTRNDYGHGLDIDPHTQPLEPSLTSLSPAEMQEGATRMGVNLVLYFLSQGGQVDSTFLARTGHAMRAARDRSAADAPAGAERPWEGFADAAGWFAETWGDAATWAAADGGVRVRFEVADKEKAAFGRVYEPAWTLEARDVLAIDLVSRLSCGTRVALGLSVGSDYFEAAPCYVKPGANRIFFRCDARTFKTAASGWEYRAALPLPAAVGKVNLVIYAPAGGEFELRNARVVRLP